MRQASPSSKGSRTSGLSLMGLLFFALAFSLKAAPPAPGINQSAGFWTQAVGEGNLSSLDESLSTVRLWIESQGRFNNANPMENMNFYQGMIRTALGYAVTDRLTLWAGYTYLPTENYGQGYVGEQDAWPGMRYIFPLDWARLPFAKWSRCALFEVMRRAFGRGHSSSCFTRLNLSREWGWLSGTSFSST